VVWLLGEQLVQDGDRLLAVAEGGVIWRLGSQQRKRVKSARLEVLRIVGIHLLHRLRVGLRTRLIFASCRIAVEVGQRCDVFTLARGLRCKRLCLLHLFPSELEFSSIRTRPELVPQAHSHAPVSQGALRIILFYLFELLAGFLVPERVQEGHAALK